MGGHFVRRGGPGAMVARFAPVWAMALTLSSASAGPYRPQPERRDDPGAARERPLSMDPVARGARDRAPGRSKPSPGTAEAPHRLPQVQATPIRAREPAVSS